MKFIALATTALSFLASCAFAAPFDAETGISPLGVRASGVDVVAPNSNLLVKKAAADIAAMNDKINDILAKRDDVVLDAIATAVVNAKVIIDELSVEGILWVDVQAKVVLLVDVIVDLKVAIDAVVTLDIDVVDISIQLNAFIELILSVCVTLSAEFGLDACVTIFANIQVALNALIVVCVDVVVGLDVLLVVLVDLQATVLIALDLSLTIGGTVIGI